MTTTIAPRASLFRRLAWVLRGGPKRLRRARLRREAIFGDPMRVLTAILWPAPSTPILFAAIRAEPHDLAARRRLLTRIVLAELGPRRG